MTETTAAETEDTTVIADETNIAEDVLVEEAG